MKNIHEVDEDNRDDEKKEKDVEETMKTEQGGGV